MHFNLHMMQHPNIKFKMKHLFKKSFYICKWTDVFFHYNCKYSGCHPKGGIKVSKIQIYTELECIFVSPQQ